MKSLRDAAFALDAPAPTWSLRETLKVGIWPPLQTAPGGHVSVHALITRFSTAGANLRKLSTGTQDVWAHINRSQLVSQLRDRLRDPGIMRQSPTGLCGPFAVVLELARRLPAEYVRAATELFETGKFTTLGGQVITAAQELRDEPVPQPKDGIEEIDWLLAATMRDDANVHEDVDDTGYGLESLTLWGAMSDWTDYVLGLQYHWETCFVSGELDAIRNAQKAINAGGVAFLLIDSDLIQNYESGEPPEAEEEMFWERANHKVRTPAGAFGSTTHSKDDNFPPDHWVVFLGHLQLGSDDGPIRMQLWSWGGEYIVHGTADSFSEYLYAVVTGVPS